MTAEILQNRTLRLREPPVRAPGRVAKVMPHRQTTRQGGQDMVSFMTTGIRTADRVVLSALMHTSPRQRAVQGVGLMGGRSSCSRAQAGIAPCRHCSFAGRIEPVNLTFPPRPRERRDPVVRPFEPQPL